MVPSANANPVWWILIQQLRCAALKHHMQYISWYVHLCYTLFWFHTLSVLIHMTDLPLILQGYFTGNWTSASEETLNEKGRITMPNHNEMQNSTKHIVLGIYCKDMNKYHTFFGFQKQVIAPIFSHIIPWMETKLQCQSIKDKWIQKR